MQNNINSILNDNSQNLGAINNPSLDKQMNKLCYVQAGRNYSMLNRSKLTPFRREQTSKRSHCDKITDYSTNPNCDIMEKVTPHRQINDFLVFGREQAR